jgi:hypothetical protein
LLGADEREMRDLEDLLSMLNSMDVSWKSEVK